MAISKVSASFPHAEDRLLSSMCVTGLIKSLMRTTPAVTNRAISAERRVPQVIRDTRTRFTRHLVGDYDTDNTLAPLHYERYCVSRLLELNISRRLRRSYRLLQSIWQGKMRTMLYLSEQADIDDAYVCTYILQSTCSRSPVLFTHSTGH